jgi:pSer/pThr/pTyr-binding forkhead associated (FHA) protein
MRAENDTMQCLVCKKQNPDSLTHCAYCESELLQKKQASDGDLLPHKQDKQDIFRSYLLCPPMNPIELELGKEYSAGRDHTCSIILASNNVSRKNTSFRVLEDGIYVIDNGSRNGTILNKNKLNALEPTRLQDHDEIRVGPYSIIYRFVSGPIEDYPNETEKLGSIITNETMDVDVGDMSGDLSKNKCEDILQMIGLTKKTGMLEVYDEQGIKGSFYFRDGFAIHALYKEFQGKEAALKLLSLKEGNFRFSNMETLEGIEQTIKTPTHKLILDSLKQYDEENHRLLQQLLPKEKEPPSEKIEKELSNHIPKFDFFSDLNPPKIDYRSPLKNDPPPKIDYRFKKKE